MLFGVVAFTNLLSSLSPGSALQSLCKQVQAERDKLTEDLEKLQRSATPRPDWERCAMYVEGGATRWVELAVGRSSDGKVDILLSQLAGIPESELARGEPFIGQVSTA